MKKKALLIGNGFTSQLIPAYTGPNLMACLKERLPSELAEIEKFFSKFRIEFDEKLFMPEYQEPWYELDSEVAELYWSPFVCGEYKNEQIRAYLCGVLSEIGFVNHSELCDKFFFDAGLGYEIARNQITSIETPFKIIELAREMDFFPAEWGKKLYEETRTVLYNNGHFHFSDCNELINRKRAIDFFEKFATIFTTNYDLIIDDLVNDKVKHLHGGFCFKAPNLKQNKVADVSKCYMILGANGEKKSYSLIRHQNEGPPTLLQKYFEALSTEDFLELHILGYSGENDNHISNAILNNKKIKKIVYYGDPEKINDKGYIFHHARKYVFDPIPPTPRFEMKSWDEFWEQIK